MGPEGLGQKPGSAALPVELSLRGLYDAGGIGSEGFRPTGGQSGFLVRLGLSSGGGAPGRIPAGGPAAKKKSRPRLRLAGRGYDQPDFRQLFQHWRGGAVGRQIFGICGIRPAAQVEERTSGYLGRPYSLPANITYSLGYVRRDNLLDPAIAEEALFAQVGEVSSQYIISVDGQPVGANPSKTALELLKQRLLSAQVGADENAQAEFVQDVTIEQANVPDSYASSIAEIEQALSGERSAMQVYAVQQGDTLSQIAERNGMTLQQVQGLNPHIDPDRIHIGEQITIAGSKPMLSVKKTTVLEYTQPIAYETEVQYSDEMYKNESKIITEGQNGQASVVANVVSVDGVEQERIIQSWDVIQQPQSEVKLVGTKALPTKAAKGYFIQPFRGILTSRFGARSRGYHTGVDWAGAYGSPVVAADGGTVIQAGWNGGYGYCVTIDHGNGLSTLYAHNSSLLVKVGQKVAQGEQIAKLGSTGNSTGPHCHWEVRVNGKAVNPMGYLK